MQDDYFKNKAEGWERSNRRIANVDNIVRAMRGRIHFDADMKIMDFGSGTGLLLERIAPLVGKITAVDTSKAMNDQLAAKRDRLECELEIIEADLSTTSLERKFDGIISSMTIHHVEDIPSLLGKFHAMLNDGGFIAIADLDAEDGSFHSEDMGVFHFGFDRDELLQTASNSGFMNPVISTANVMQKPERNYPVFLLTATR